MYKYMILRLGADGDFTLKFKIRDTPVAELWIERMRSRGDYPLDQPDRFYGFDKPGQETQRAIDLIKKCIDTINSYEFIIRRSFTFDQDCLNYLHNIFERYHGLLDQQNTKFWERAPIPVRQALAELNIAVHRCESVLSGNPPRLVCTWFGMPKTHCLDATLQAQYGNLRINFGTVYLNYCEIGKTLEDLAHDQDTYIADNAFKPFDHYSADFNIAFYDKDLNDKLPGIAKYLNEHRDFFIARNIDSVYNVHAMPLRFPVADLEETLSRGNIISLVAQNQYVKQVVLE